MVQYDGECIHVQYLIQNTLIEMQFMLRQLHDIWIAYANLPTSTLLFHWDHYELEHERRGYAWISKQLIKIWISKWENT